MEVRDQGARVPEGVGEALRSGQPQPLDERAGRRPPGRPVRVVDRVGPSGGRRARVGLRETELPVDRVEDEGVHASPRGVDEDGGGAVEDVAGRDLPRSGAQHRPGGIGLARPGSGTDAEDRPDHPGHVGVEGAVERVDAHRESVRRGGVRPHDRRLQLLGGGDRYDAGGLERLQQEVVRPDVEPAHPVAGGVDLARLAQETVERRARDLARERDPRPRERLEDGDEVGRERRAPGRRRPEVLGERRRGGRPAGGHSRALTAWPPN